MLVFRLVLSDFATMPRPKNAVIDPKTGVPRHVPVRHKRWGGFRSVVPRILVRKPVERLPTPFQLACEWCAPWSVQTYPGHTRLMLALFARSITDRAIQHWKAGRACPPVWATRTVQAYIRSRCATGLRLAENLEPYIEAREKIDQRLHLRMRGLREHGH